MVGKHNVNISEPGEQKIRVEKIIFHPNYTAFFVLKNDYALLKLQNTINNGLPHAKAVCLPINVPDVTVGMKMTVSGWGRIDPLNKYTTSPVLKSVYMVTISNTECEKPDYPRLLPSNFCVLGIEEKSSPCQGDSGGNNNCFTFYFFKMN